MRSNRLKRITVSLVSAITAVAMLASCWIPEQFETEVRFTSTGSWGVTVLGTITYAPLFGQIARGDISKADADRQIKQYQEFLKNDPGFKEINSIGNGRFQVKFSKEGQFAGNRQSFSFATRQSSMFRLRTTEDARIILSASGQGRLYAQRFEEVGLGMRGLFRVVTDAEVIEHNAQFVRATRTPGFTQYDWRIQSLRDMPPKLVAKLKVDPRTGVPAFGSGVPRGVDDDAGPDSGDPQ